MVWQGIKKNIAPIALILLDILTLLLIRYRLIFVILSIIVILVMVFAKALVIPKIKYKKSKVIQEIAKSFIGKHMKLKTLEEIPYSIIDGRPNQEVGEISEDYFTWTYLDDTGKWVGILARNFLDEDHIEFFVKDFSPEIQVNGPSDIQVLAERYVLGTGEQKNWNALFQKYNVSTQAELARKVLGIKEKNK